MRRATSLVGKSSGMVTGFMKKGSVVVRLALVLALAFFSLAAIAATVNPRPLTRSNKSKSQINESGRARRHMSRLRHSRGLYARGRRGRGRYARRRHRFYERFYTSSFTDDVADGDVTAGEDAVVRAAAVDALGNMNGTVVAIEPTSGRILAMVNQKLALSSGAQPCSTFKVAVALAALNEKLITPETQIKLGRRVPLNLTAPLAHSDKPHF